MSRQLWTETLWSVEANGTANTSGAEAILFPDQTLPFSFSAGRTIRLMAMGKFSNVVTTPGSITFRIRYGGVGGTLLAATSAIALNIVVQTDIMWKIEATIVCRLSGTSGTLLAMGQVDLAAELAASNNASNFMGSAGGSSTNTPAAVTQDLTASPIISLTYQSTVATGSITGMIYVGEAVN